MGHERRKIQVYPSEHDREQMSDQEMSFYKLLYAGLKQIQNGLGNEDYGLCSRCPYFDGTLEHAGKCYSVCNFLNKGVDPVEDAIIV